MEFGVENNSWKRDEKRGRVISRSFQIENYCKNIREEMISFRDFHKLIMIYFNWIFLESIILYLEGMIFNLIWIVITAYSKKGVKEWIGYHSCSVLTVLPAVRKTTQPNNQPTNQRSIVMRTHRLERIHESTLKQQINYMNRLIHHTPFITFLAVPTRMHSHYS